VKPVFGEKGEQEKRREEPRERLPID